MKEEKSLSLDQKISALLDKLEQKQQRNPTVEYLISQWLVPHQTSSDQELKIDKDKVFRFLKQWNANSLSEFTWFVGLFVEVGDRPPRIDLPLSTRFHIWLDRELDFSCVDGRNSLLGHIKFGPDGSDGFEKKVRQDIIQVMREYKLRTINDLITAIKKRDAEIEEWRKKKAEREAQIKLDSI